MPRSKLKIYSEQDFNSAKTKAERMYMKMLQPDDFFLTNQENRYFELLKKAWTIMENYDTILMSAKALMEVEYDLTLQVAMTAVKDAQELLGPLLKVNKDYERAILVEKAKKAYEQSMAIEDYRSAAAALNIWMKTQRLDKMDENDFKFADLTIPALEISSDPEILAIENGKLKIENEDPE